MLPRPHVTSGQLATREKTHTANQPPLTWLLAKQVATSYSQSNDSMVLHHSWFPPGPKFVFTFGVNSFHMLSWSGNNTRVLFCMLRSRHLYSQPNCSLYCTRHCCRCYCYSFRFSFLSHSFIVRTYARFLTLLAHSHLTHTHTPHAPPYSLRIKGQIL